MSVNAEAIYNTRPVAPFKENNICMTRLDDGTTYFMYMATEEETSMPHEISILSFISPLKDAQITLLGSKTKVEMDKTGNNGFKIFIPRTIQQHPPSKYVWTFKVTAIK
ncbi:MAG: hypothetical protein M9948_01145 [Lentimicrobium sp.]|nr:hypothetical protein [Lentimicrobium sp.]